MTQETVNKPDQPIGPPTRWQENHGNVLSGFVAMVMVIGVCILFYRQSRFVPPRFPESEMIPTPVTEDGEQDDDDDEAAKMVTIKVTGAISEVGSIKIAVYGSESDFEDTSNAVASNSAVVVEGESVWRIAPKKLPSKIAVAAYHDENDDGILNRNRLGIPTERYGFSQNARGILGPPNYAQTVINRPAAGKTINIFIR